METPVQRAPLQQWFDCQASVEIVRLGYSTANAKSIFSQTVEVAKQYMLYRFKEVPGWRNAKDIDDLAKQVVGKCLDMEVS